MQSDLSGVSNNHPVWNVYDELRTARLNVKYYTRRIVVVQRLEVAFTVAFALAAPATAILGEKHLYF